MRVATIFGCQQQRPLRRKDEINSLSLFPRTWRAPCASECGRGPRGRRRRACVWASEIVRVFSLQLNQTLQLLFPFRQLHFAAVCFTQPPLSVAHFFPALRPRPNTVSMPFVTTLDTSLPVPFSPSPSSSARRSLQVKKVENAGEKCFMTTN